jgi:hypothetical protein
MRRESLHGKTSWPCYSLTAKALENITAGAKRSSSFSPELPEQEQQLQQLQEALSSSIKGKSAGNSSSSSSSARQSAAGNQQQCPASDQQQGEEQQGRHSQQQLYQQLCAVLLLQYTAKAASLPEQEAWQLLANYNPEQPQLEQHQQQQQQISLQDMQQQQQQQKGMELGDDQLLAALAAAAVSTANQAADAAAAGNGSTCTASTSMYELQEAAVQDDDDEEYEAVETMELSAASHSSGSRYHSSTPAEQQQQQCSWPALQHKLCSLAEHVHYSLISYELLWRQQEAAQHLLQLLRALGVHSRTEDLQPVLHAYVGLLVDRLAAAPADLPLLQQLWEALGLTGGQGLGFKASSSKNSRQQALPSEAVLGFSVAASVWGQLPGTNARAKLWRLMYDNLLPLLEQSCEQLAYNAASSSSSAKHQQQQAAVQGEGFAHALLLCHVIELLLLGRPAAVDVAGKLVQQGVMRSLVVLFGQHSGNAAAEPVR